MPISDADIERAIRKHVNLLDKLSTDEASADRETGGSGDATSLTAAD